MVDWNESNQPVGESGGLLATFLGAVARNFSNFPICYERWPLVPKLYKDNTYKDTIQGKFDVNSEKHKEYILQNLGRKWKDNRCKLFNTHYDFDKTRDQNLQSCPDGIELDHWASFIDYRMKAKTLALCDKNAENRQKQTVPHTLGSKSMARKKHELEIANNRPYTRSQMYSISHKKKDGSYVNDEAREKSEQLSMLESEGTCSQNALDDDPFGKLFGKEHPGCVRGIGFGVCPSQVQNPSSSHCGGTTSSCSHNLDSAKLQQMEVEMKESKTTVSMLQAQLNYFVTHYMGGVLPPDFPSIGKNEAGDMESPAQARRSSSASHDPEHGPSKS